MADQQTQAAIEAGASDTDIALIRDLKNRAAEFESQRQQLVAMGPAIARSGDNALMLEYGQLVARADSLKSKITTALNLIDQAIAAVKRVVGISGMRTLGDLGVWFLPAAGIAVIIGALGFWVTDWLKFKSKARSQLQLQQELIEGGTAPAAAAREAAQVYGRPATNWMLWLALAGAAIVGINYAMKAAKR